MTEQAEIAVVAIQNESEDASVAKSTATTVTAAATMAIETAGTAGAAPAAASAPVATTTASYDQDMYADEADPPVTAVKKYAKRTVALHTGYVGTGYYGEAECGAGVHHVHECISTDSFLAKNSIDSNESTCTLPGCLLSFCRMQEAHAQTLSLDQSQNTNGTGNCRSWMPPIHHQSK